MKACPIIFLALVAWLAVPSSFAEEAPETKREKRPKMEIRLDLTAQNSAPGDIPDESFGKDLVVGEDTKTGERYFRGRTDKGEIKVTKQEFTGDFTVGIEVIIPVPHDGTLEFSLLDAAGNPTSVIIKGHTMTFGAEVKRLMGIESWASKKLNVITLTKSGKTLKCVVNNQVYASVPVEASLKVTAIQVKGILQKTRIYRVGAATLG